MSGVKLPKLKYKKPNEVIVDKINGLDLKKNFLYSNRSCKKNSEIMLTIMNQPIIKINSILNKIEKVHKK